MEVGLLKIPLAEVTRIELVNARVKVSCLTAWLYLYGAFAQNRTENYGLQSRGYTI